MLNRPSPILAIYSFIFTGSDTQTGYLMEPLEVALGLKTSSRHGRSQKLDLSYCLGYLNEGKEKAHVLRLSISSYPRRRPSRQSDSPRGESPSSASSGANSTESNNSARDDHEV